MIVTDDISQLPRTWYHGTSSLHIDSFNRKGISVNSGRRKSDFGRGFYLTSNWEQAYRWAKSACKREKAVNPHKELFPIIVECEVFTEAFRELDYKIFTETDIEWAHFILENRTIQETIAYNMKDNLFNPELKGLSSYEEETLIQMGATSSPYHCIYGPMADGRNLRLYLERVKRGKMTHDEFLKSVTSIKYKFPISHQLSINTDEATHYVQMRGVFNIAKGIWQQPVRSREAQ